MEHGGGRGAGRDRAPSYNRRLPRRRPRGPRPLVYDPPRPRGAAARHPGGRPLRGIVLRNTPIVVIGAALAAVLLTACLHPGAPPRDIAPAGVTGAVASGEPAATEAGLETLRSGGNAVDAIVATALALAVVHPQAGNLGGGGFAVVRSGGTVAALDFREPAPAAATRDMYRDADGRAKGDLSIVGPLAAGVPGSPAGLYELHRRYGRRPWESVVLPAVRLARDGFKVTPRLSEAIAWYEETFAKFP